MRAAGARRAVAALGLLILAASALVGGNLLGLRDRLLGSATPSPRPAATSFVAVHPTGKAKETVLRSQPWWQRVDELRGSGPTTTPTLPIDRSAIQWRVRWTCQRARLTVRAAGQARPLVNASCPGSGTANGSGAGRTRLQVAAAGPWSVRVEQQIDVPLDEPPLPAMSAPGTRTAATGTVYRVDQSATGKATIYRLADGRFALRLAGFFVTPNVDLEIRLSTLRAPHSTRQIMGAPSKLVAPLPITAGSLNFRVPPTVDPTRYRSLVIWCPPNRSAYAAAVLAWRR